MTMTDPVADYLTRLRNAIQAGHKKVDVPASNLKRELTKLLLAHKFIASDTPEVKESACRERAYGSS
jgi:ribosomal protein S8